MSERVPEMTGEGLLGTTFACERCRRSYGGHQGWAISFADGSAVVLCAWCLAALVRAWRNDQRPQRQEP
jgi:hypothetical protein